MVIGVMMPLDFLFFLFWGIVIIPAVIGHWQALAIVYTYSI